MPPDDYLTNNEVQIILLDILACAAAEGWQAGRDLGSYVRDCPYCQLMEPLKDAWLNGFTAGRATSLGR